MSQIELFLTSANLTQRPLYNLCSQSSLEICIEGTYQGWLHQKSMSEPSFSIIWYFYLWQCIYLLTRNQTGVYERTLHDRKIVTPSDGEAFEIIGDTVCTVKSLDKVMTKISLLKRI